jgi:hypothetical protein
MKELIIDESEGSQTRLMITDTLRIEQPEEEGESPLEFHDIEFTIVQTSIGYDGVREYRPPVVLTKRGILNLHRAITNEIIGL